jgi:hypothetical protein
MKISSQYSKADLISRCPEHQVAPRLPLPILDKLAEAQHLISEAGGGNTPMKELLGLCIYMATGDGDELIKRLHEFRTATVETMPQFTEPTTE